jgi:hypothetical protein
LLRAKREAKNRMMAMAAALHKLIVATEIEVGRAEVLSHADMHRKMWLLRWLPPCFLR